MQEQKGKKIKVLMVGPDKSVKGGMTSVVNGYYDAGLNKMVDLKYISSIYGNNRIKKGIAEIKGIIKFKQNIKKFDIVHIHMSSKRSVYRKIIYIKIAKKYNKKVVVHAHGSEFKKFYEQCTEKQKKYIKESFKLIDVLIVLSEEWKEYYKKICDENKIKIIYNGTRIPKNLVKDYTSDYALYLGKFGERKGIYDLIDVTEKIAKKYDSFVLYAGGDGEIDKVNKIVEEKGLQNHIKVLGWIGKEEKEKYLKKCSIFILPSYNEGMPMALIEAMAYRNASISTNVGGIPKVIDNNKNGIMIEPGNKTELYNVIEKLIVDKQFKEKIAVAGYEKAKEKFNIENNIKEVYNIYVELMKEENK